MIEIDNGGPAFPQFEVVAGERDGHGDVIDAYTTAHGGMSLRDWFAGQALMSAVGDYERIETRGPNRGEPRLPYGCQAMSREQIIAAAAYKFADAMLEARKVKS